MSWKPLAVGYTGKARRGIALCLGLKTVRVVFGPDVMEKLGLVPGVRVSVSVGEGENTGSIRLTLGELGLIPRKTSQGGRSLSVIFRRWPALQVDKCEAMSCDFKEVEQGQVEVKLPYWGQAGKLRALRSVG